jgi:protein TonB
LILPAGYTTIKSNIMKNYFNIFVLALIVLIAQSCTPDAKKEETAVPIKANEVTVLTASEKKARLEKQRSERQAIRNAEIQRLAKISPTYKDSKGNVVFLISEVAPSYNGGDDAMMDFLNDNIKFPKEAEEKGVEGTVFVDFIVAANGIVREVQVTDETNEDVDQSFRNEAIRLVSSMPAWVPGRQHGKAVDVRFTIPITFQMM